MTEYYRIVSREFAASPLGYGNSGARWNPKNVPIIYAASAVSVSTSEFLCIKGSALVDAEWSLVTFTIEGDIPFLEKEGLPIDWDARPYSLSTQLFGERWVRSAASVCIKVPSARLPLSAYPREHNLLINPLHADFRDVVKVKGVEELHFHLNEWATGDR